MKVIVKQRENREQAEIFSIEEFVPADHLLRKNRNRLLVLTPTDITIFNFTFRIARSDARIHPVSVFPLISVYIFFDISHFSPLLWLR